MTGMTGWGLAAGDELVPGRVVHRLLGGGGSYEAYLVFDDGLLHAAVAKVLRPGRVQDPVARRAMTREAAALDTVRHPVIVRGFDAVLGGDRPHLLLEHLEGPRLSSLVRRHGPLALEQLLPLALELASALHYLAGRELVHLDVKPGNVVMGAPARLIDLSVARSVDEAAALRHVVGTDGYLSPEQAAPGRRSGRPGVRRLRVGRDAVPREHRPGTGAGRRGPRGRSVGLRRARCSPASTRSRPPGRLLPRSPRPSSRSSRCCRDLFSPASGRSGPVAAPRRRTSSSGGKRTGPEGGDPHQAGAEDVRRPPGRPAGRSRTGRSRPAPAPSTTPSSTAHAAGQRRGASPARSATSSPRVRPTSRKTRSACSWVTASRSNGSRCGRVLVAGVRAGAGDDGARGPGSQRPRPAARGAGRQRPARSHGRGPVGPRRARRPATATAIRAIDSRKWAITVTGFRPVSTVTPPSSACATMPRNSTSAGRSRSRRPARQAVTRAAATAAEQREGEHPVAELDHAVGAHLAGGDEAVVGAAGERRAAEPGGGQPDRAAGHDDRGVHDQGAEERAAQRRLRRPPRDTGRACRQRTGL